MEWGSKLTETPSRFAIQWLDNRETSPAPLEDISVPASIMLFAAASSGQAQCHQ